VKVSVLSINRSWHNNVNVSLTSSKLEIALSYQTITPNEICFPIQIKSYNHYLLVGTRDDWFHIIWPDLAWLGPFRGGQRENVPHREVKVTFRKTDLDND
jgi:hypothetical protein